MCHNPNTRDDDTLEHPGLGCLCFSMNRPLQLAGYLESIRRFARPRPSITVLFRATEKTFFEGYRDVAHQNTDVRFIGENNFAQQTTDWLKEAEPHVMFGCDDALFIRNIDIAAALDALNHDPDLLGCSLRLGANIRFSHSAAGEVPQPDFRQHAGLLTWDWRKASAQWNYPFELDGTIYRRDFLMHLLDMLDTQRQAQPMAEWRHPNLLELRGNEWLKNHADAPSRMCCFAESTLIVPTVNRVQDLFKNPLMGDVYGIEELEQRRRRGWRLNLDAFHARAYDRIHVGDFFLDKASGPAPGAEADVEWLRSAGIARPEISIVMAAWQAQKYIGTAIRSILAQQGVEFELVVVDDASSDATLATILSFDDPRMTVGRLAKRVPAGAVRNQAIRRAKAPWICIFDADDIMEPGALAAYFHAVVAQPDCRWAYCALQLIDADGNDMKMRMNTPFDLLKMLQKNIVAHPMSLYRRELFELAGGYDETLPNRQDYDLWLRFLPHATPFFHNAICVRYRRHPQSIGANQSGNDDPRAARIKMSGLLANAGKNMATPRVRRLGAILAFLDASDQRQWERVISLGTELAGLDCGGFELDQRMVEALIGAGRRTDALALVFKWLRKMAENEPLLPYESHWALRTGLELLKALGLTREAQALVPLAKLVLQQSYDPSLANLLADM